MIDAETIIELWQRRREEQGPSLQRCREVLDAYNGELALPMLPGVSEEVKSAVPNLVMGGIDAQAMRIASTLANVYCAPLRPGIKRSEDLARTRRKAILGWWEANRLDLKDRRRARWLVGFGSAPVTIRPSSKTMAPQWVPRDPLGTFPAPCEDPDDMEPSDCVFAYSRAYRWLRSNYSDAYGSLDRPKRFSLDDRVHCVEYMDDAEHVLVVTAGSYSDRMSDSDPAVYANRGEWSGGRPYEALVRLDNRTGMCPAVVPGRVTLGRLGSVYDNIVGMYRAQAMMFALNTEAVINDIFVNEWIVDSVPGQPAKVVNMANGREGIVGQINGGDIKSAHQTPGNLTMPTIDRYERNQRVTAGIPPELGGESGSNIRTGRRGDSIIANAVDFPVQEHQTILARAREAENRRAVAVAKAYYGNTPASFYVSWPRAKGWVNYTPNQAFETDQNKVTYPYAGADANNLTVIAGQLVGTGLASVETMREIHPFIDDPESEHDRVTAEALERSLLGSIEQMAGAGQMDPAAIARLMVLVKSDQMELAEAYIKAHEQAQERQAPDVNPVAPGSPEAQPGLAPAGVGAEAGTSIPPPEPGITNLAQQLGALYRGGGAQLQRGAA